ncbi:hypothetical protein L7F22_029583 [Adiantum nelumboides]|nr:hypothetical protein [Adiantum nelumboides]
MMMESYCPRTNTKTTELVDSVDGQGQQEDMCLPSAAIAAPEEEPNWSHLANPMYALMKKKAAFIWDSKCQEGFENIKEIIFRKPILKQPRWDVVFYVHVDASGIALGAILAQPEGEVDFPIYFASRRLSQAEQVYTTTEREALGMVFAIQKFRHYLLGHFFVFYVDHQALLYLINKVVIQGQIFRWMLLLQEFEFKIIHKPGKNHFGAYFLSRATPEIGKTGISDELPDAPLFGIQEVTDDSDMAKYLQTGDLPIGWLLKRKKTLIMQSRNFTWAARALYRLGKDGVLRRCVQEEERIELLEEAHEGNAGGHMSGGKMKEGDLVLWYPGKLDARKKSLTRADALDHQVQRLCIESKRLEENNEKLQAQRLCIESKILENNEKLQALKREQELKCRELEALTKQSLLEKENASLKMSLEIILEKLKLSDSEQERLHIKLKDIKFSLQKSIHEWDALNVNHANEVAAFRMQNIANECRVDGASVREDSSVRTTSSDGS